jgi:Flp pilus assembly protein TadG
VIGRVAPRTAGDRGVAALELTLFLTLLMGILALLAPLGNALLSKVRLERAAGQAARFATQYTGHNDPGAANSQPSGKEICTEARQTATDAGLASSVTEAADTNSTHYVGCTVTLTPASGAAPSTITLTDTSTTPTRASGDTVTVTLTFTQNLAAFGGILSAAGLGSSNIDLSATSLARQE